MRGGVGDGDKLIATKPDRIARSTRDLLDIADQISKRGVALRIQPMGGASLHSLAIQVLRIHLWNMGALSSTGVKVRHYIYFTTFIARRIISK